MQLKSVLLKLLLNLILFALVTNSYKIRKGELLVIPKNSYKTYWNVPTQQCKAHMDFIPLLKKYNIHQNEFDKFQGDVISILYDTGSFPAIIGSSPPVYKNGGVPQQGNLTLHLNMFRDRVNEYIPNVDFPGIGVIDFESWRPIFSWHWGSPDPYKELSYDIERQLHPSWPNKLIEKEAARRFELYARIFMEETLIYAKQIRPKATWGYYHYPYCFNFDPGNMNTECSPNNQKENDSLDWLFLESDNLYPSLYFYESLTPKQRQQLIEGRVQEAHRIIKKINKPQDQAVLPYFWFKYGDTNKFLTKDDIDTSLYNLKKFNATGVIICGSSNDVNSKRTCQELYEYVDNVLGPAVNST